MLKRQRHETTLAGCLILAVLTVSAAARAAEVRGVVTVQQTGIFNDRVESIKSLPVSVALYPAEGQTLARPAAVEHVITVAGNRIAPLYLALSRGDRLRFENQDDVYHQLFTHSNKHPIQLRLEPNDLGRTAEIVLNEVVDLHWFCHIHAKSYARIDVLDTSLVRMVTPGDIFEFRDLPVGKWRLRVAAPGAETRIVEAQALTAPPPLQIRLDVKGFNQSGRGAMPVQAVAIEQLFPTQPGF